MLLSAEVRAAKDRQAHSGMAIEDEERKGKVLQTSNLGFESLLYDRDLLWILLERKENLKLPWTNQATGLLPL